MGAKWSNPAGPASLYASMPVAHNMIGLYLAVGNANHLPAWGGLDMLLSTNPIAIAMPGENEAPVVLDMATTVATVSWRSTSKRFNRWRISKRASMRW